MLGCYSWSDHRWSGCTTANTSLHNNRVLCIQTKKKEISKTRVSLTALTYVLHTYVILLWYFRSTDSQSISLPMCYINPGKSSHITVFITIIYCTSLVREGLSQPESTPLSQPESTPLRQPESTPLGQPESTPLSQPESTPLSQPESTPLSQLQKELKGKNMLFPKSSLQLGRVIGQGER